MGQEVMKFELNREEISEAITDYVKKKVVTNLYTKIEVTQTKSAKATVTISEMKPDQDNAG